MINERELADGTTGLVVSNGDVEVAVSTAYGPRIMHYAAVRGENLLGEAPDASIVTPLGTWRARGGHRLWHAPEATPRTYEPDNERVEWSVVGSTALETTHTDVRAGVEKTMRVRVYDRGSQVDVEHVLRNVGPWTIELAPWALTIMRPGGEVEIPREPFQPHTENVLPVRSLVLWGYTDLEDPRLTLGTERVLVRTDAGIATPLKIGASNRVGHVSYRVGTTRFIKRFGYIENARYPDMGCNCEVYVAGEFLELETLGPLTLLQPGASVSHIESWELEEFDEEGRREMD